MLRDADAPDLPVEEPIVVHRPVQGTTAETGIIVRSAGTVRATPETETGRPAHPGGILAAEASTAISLASPPESERLAAAAEPTQEPKRANSLDALRGLFLVLMTLGFTIHGSHYPDWMYHRQFPPPGNLVPMVGLTWRDLAYAAFLFTMAAALPITLSRRIEKGETEISILLAVVRRFLLLFVFALLIGHSNTFFTGYTEQTRIVAIVGFVIMFAVFTRRRADWSETWFKVMKSAGWMAAIAFLLVSPLIYDGTFSPARRDDIIAGLAFAALSGSVIWYFTRTNLGARLAILAGVVALYLGAQSEGWIQEWWWSSPAPWLMRPSSLGLLAVAVPGTIAGDLLLRWMRSPRIEAQDELSWNRGRLRALLVLCLAIVPVVVIGLDNRWVQETTVLVLALCATGSLLTWHPRHPGERLVRGLFLWAALWLVLGLLLDPAEGGIRKVPETLSYFFTVTGLTAMLLVAFVASIDLLRRGAWARPLVDVGHNPMLAYVTYTVLLNSLFELIPEMRSLLRSSPGESFLRSLLATALVVLIVRTFTRRRIYWRT